MLGKVAFEYSVHCKPSPFRGGGFFTGEGVVAKFTSLIPPGTPVSDPTDPLKVIGAVASVFLSVLFLGLIIFLCVDFSLEQLGRPIHGALPSTEAVDQSREDDRPWRKRLFTAEEIQSQFRIVAPPDRSLIVGNQVAVLCRWTPTEPGMEGPPIQPQLYFDEMLVPWTMSFGANVWFAQVKAESGEHRLRLLGKDLTVFVHDSVPTHSGGEKKRNQLIIHEGTDDPARCGECHVVIQGKNDVVHKSRGLTIGPLRPAESCFSCHKTEAVEQRHSKLVKLPGNDCAVCHRLHGEQPNDQQR